MNTSAPTTASFNVPVNSSRLVCSASHSSSPSSPSRPRCTTPAMSATTTSPAPAASSSLMIAVPAAPAPEMTILTSLICLPTTRSALYSAASTTIAVPCWSSWNTGMSSCSRSRRSISKQRGAEMSSRLIPAKPGATALTTAMISSTSWVSRHNGQASMSPNRLNSAALPSITGSAASGPMLPKPEHSRPVGDHRDAVAFHRQSAGVLRILRDGQADPGHARRVDHRQVVPVADRVLAVHLDLAAQVHQERAVRHLPDHHALDLLHRLHQQVCMLGVPGRTGDVDPQPFVPGRRHVEGRDRPARMLHRRGQLGDRAPTRRHLEPHSDRIRH